MKQNGETPDSAGLATSASTAAVLYIGELATYLCDSGDFMPTYPPEHPITEELLGQFCAQTDNGERPVGLSRAKSTELPEAPSPSPLAASLEPAWCTLARKLSPSLQNRDAVIVFPLSSTPSFQSRLLVYLFSPWIGLRSTVLLSDVVADTIACGSVAMATSSGGAQQDQGDGGGGGGGAGPGAASALGGSLPTLVVHAGLGHVTLARICDGSATRYTVSRVGGLQALRQAAGDSRHDRESGHGAAKGDEPTAFAVVRDAQLHAPPFRSDLVAAFGFRAYARALAHSVELPPSHAKKTGRKGNVKSKAGVHKRGRRRGGEEEEEAWKAAFSRKQRRDPGSLEKLLARVAGASDLNPETPLPTILCGEALRNPFMATLLREVVRRCGEERVTRVVEAEARAKARRQRREAKQKERQAKEEEKEELARRGQQSVLPASATTRQAKRARSGDEAKVVGKQSPSVRRRKGRRSDGSSDDGSEGESADEEESNGSEQEEEEQTSTARSPSPSSSDAATTPSSSSEDEAGSSTSDDSEEEELEGHGLVEQPQPVPQAPWGLALIGGSIVSELSLGELARMRVTSEEVKSTKGAIAHWKAVL